MRRKPGVWVILIVIPLLYFWPIVCQYLFGFGGFLFVCLLVF